MRFFHLFLLVVISFSLYAKETFEHSSSQQAYLKNYFETGKYFEEITKQLMEAKDYIARQLQEHRSHRLAIVLDIDETALSNYHDLERLHFTKNVQALTAAHMLAGAIPITPVLELYQYACANKIKIFFISERPNTPEFIAITVQNLKTAGFIEWEGLILKPIENNQSIVAFKTQARRQIASQDFDIILNIGDQTADLKGGYAEVKLKLPNPFYEVG